MATPESELLNPFIRSCEKEISEPLEGNIKGRIPNWLKGTLVRNGSGTMHVGKDQYNHVFDGLALLRQFTIKDGRVTYSNKFLRSDTYRKNMKANRIVVDEFGTIGAPDPCRTIFQRLFSFFYMFDMTDNDVVNVANFSNEYFALTETKYMWKFDPESLESLEKVSISDFVPVKTSTAHPHQDPDGTTYNVGTMFSARSYYTIYKVPPKEPTASSPFAGAEVISNLPITRWSSPGYYHSFGMSENYFVFIELSLQLNIPMLFKTLYSSSTRVSDCLLWKPENKPRFFVVRRDNGEIHPIHYTADPLMVFHHINAYEDDGHLVVDLCSYKDGEVVKALYVEALREASKHPEIPSLQAEAKRYVLPLNIQKDGNNCENLVRIPGCTAKAVFCDDGTVFCEPQILTRTETWYTELPRINYDFNAKKYKYFYAIGKKLSDKEAYLVKVNADEGTVLSWHGADEIPSEPVFVASKDPKSEDDGVLLASLLSTKDDKKVSLVVLDAKTMTELARADFTTESSIPADFHGIFIENN